jgi:eukaryotic-like serine/threonine-protein kinase
MIGTEAASLPRLGKYELLAELASGGMATVYVARHLGVPGAERLVVIKRVHRHLLKAPQFREMFHDEARLASQIRHPNVVRLLDVLDDDGELLLVLEYIESISLSALVRRVAAAGERLTPAVASRIVADALLGLHAAHETKDVRGRELAIVHRDVSPQNVLVSVEGVGYLIDFGVAKAASRMTETTGGVIKGKLAYMSPEQAKGMEVDRRSDVFSAGIVLFEALTGRRLFANAGKDGSSVLLDILLEPIDPPSHVVSGIPEVLDAVVEQALERVRDERFPTATAFHDALVAAVPPAPAKEVAQVVERFAGPMIRGQRAEILRILDGLTDPLKRLSIPIDIPVILTDGEREVVATSAATKVVAVMEPVGTKRSRTATVLALIAFVCVSAAAFLWMRTQTSPTTTRTTAPEPNSAPAPTAIAAATATNAASTAPVDSSSVRGDGAVGPSSSESAVAARPDRSAMPRDKGTRTKHAVPSISASAALSSSPSASSRTDLHPENPY